jgi:hypothetical protein
LGRDREIVKATLRSLIDHRLVRRVQSSEYYELTHDYLVEEIKGWISEDAKRIKEAREMLSRALADWRSSRVLIDLMKLQRIGAQRGRLAFGREECELLLRSAARYEYEIAYWLSRVPEVDDQVACLADTLTSEQTPDSEERIHVLRSLSRIKIGKVGQILQRVALDDDDAQVRQAAAMALTCMGAGEAIKELAHVAWDAKGDQRARAVEALAWVWDTNATLLPDLGWSLYEKVARRVVRIRLSRAWGSIRSVTVGGAVGGAVGFGLGPALVVCLNFAQLHGAAASAAIAPLIIAIYGILGFAAGALVALGIGTGQALGPGRRVLAPTLVGVAGGSIGFAAGLGLSGLAWGQSPLTVMPPAALTGALLACGIAVATGMNRSPFARLMGGALGGTLGFAVLAVTGTLPSPSSALVLAAGPIIGLAIAYGIVRGEAPVARSEAASADSRGL